jgi:hypothetical protein
MTENDKRLHMMLAGFGERVVVKVHLRKRSEVVPSFAFALSVQAEVSSVFAHLGEYSPSLGFEPRRFCH